MIKISLIVKIGADVRDFDKQMKKLTKDISTITGKLETVGTNLTRAVTVPIAGLGAIAIKMGADFEASMSKLSAVTNASGKDFDNLQSMALKMGAETKYSALQAADGMTELAKAGMTSDQVIKAIPGVLAMAATENMNLADAATIASGIMNNFGISADKAGMVADVLAKNSNMSASSVQSLGEAFRSVGGLAAQMGLSFTDINAALGILSNNGLDGAIAGDKLNQVIRAMAAPSGEATKTMQSLGLSFFDTNGKMKPLPAILDEINSKTAGMGDAQKIAALKTIFGSDAIAALLPLLKQGGSGLSDYSGQLQNSSGAAQDLADKSNNNLKGAIENLKGSLETAGIVLYNNFGKNIKGVVDKITGLVNAFSNLSPETQKNIIIILGLVAALGPFLLAVAKITMLVTNFQAGMKLAGEGASIFSKILYGFGGPTALIIAAILAVIAVIALIILNWDKVKAFTIKIWNEIVGFLQGIWEKIGPPIMAVWNAVSSAAQTAWTTIQSIWGTVVEWFQNIWNALTTSLAPLWQEISGTFQMAWDVIKLIWDLVQPYFAGIWEAIKAVFSVVGTILGAFFKNAWEIIKAVWDVVSSYFKAVWESIKAIFSVVAAILGGFFKVAWEVIKAVWNVVVAFFTLVWAGIKAVFAVVKGILSGDFSDAWDAIKNVWDKAKAFFQSIWDGIKNVFGAVGTWFGSVFSAAWTAIKNVFSAWGSFFSGLWNTIKNTFSNLGTNIANAISGAVKSGINGVISMIEGTINTAVNLINGAIRLINKIPGVNIGSVGRVSLPRLATGGTLQFGAAIVGEAGPELLQQTSSGVKVTPLSSDEKAAGIGGALTGAGFGGTIIVPVMLDGRMIAKVTAPFMDRELKNVSNNKRRGGK